MSTLILIESSFPERNAETIQPADAAEECGCDEENIRPGRAPRNQDGAGGEDKSHDELLDRNASPPSAESKIDSKIDNGTCSEDSASHNRPRRDGDENDGHIKNNDHQYKGGPRLAVAQTKLSASGSGDVGG